MVEPLHALEGGILDRFKAAPRTAPVDYLGNVEFVDFLGRSVVEAGADAADPRFDPSLGKALGVLAGHVLDDQRRHRRTLSRSRHR